MKNYAYLVISCLFLLTACASQVTQTTNTTPANGRVVMTVTDAAANMATITSIMMTVDTVALHSDAGGWVNVATPQQTYDLLSLKASGSQALLTELSLPPGRYDQMRLDVSRVTVTDVNGTHDAKLPSGALRLNGEIVVLSNKTATVSFDFIADQSLHTAANGLYIFAPVIQLESRTDATADTSNKDNVRNNGGNVQTSSRVGMDVAGNLVVGGKLPPFLRVNADGTISGTQNELKS